MFVTYKSIRGDGLRADTVYRHTGSVKDDDKRQTPANKTIGHTGPLSGPVTNWIDTPTVSRH